MPTCPALAFLSSACSRTIADLSTELAMIAYEEVEEVRRACQSIVLLDHNTTRVTQQRQQQRLSCSSSSGECVRCAHARVSSGREPLLHARHGLATNYAALAALASLSVVTNPRVSDAASLACSWWRPPKRRRTTGWPPTMPPWPRWPTR